MSIQYKSPLVSIIIPCKNACQFIDECINSIIEQTYTHWELIIVDDHSTDQSLSILQQWGNKHLNIKILPNEGTGIIDALRLAYANSNGNLITRMDADDIMTPIKLSTMITQFNISGPGNLVTGRVKYFRNDQPIGNGYMRYAEWLNSMSTKGANFEEIYKECVIPSPCWMIFREDLDRIGAFQSNTYPEDYDLVFRMYMHQLNVIPCTNEILHLWRDHRSRASRNDDNYKDNRFLELKINYFMEIDYRSDKPLVIWGAGTKAKFIAKQLITANIHFQWITDNKNKIGHNIYGTVLSSSSLLSSLSNAQIILTIANPQEKKVVKHHISSLANSGLYQSLWFC